MSALKKLWTGKSENQTNSAPVMSRSFAANDCSFEVESKGIDLAGKITTAAGLMGASALVMADEPWDTINAAVDFSNALASIGVIAGALFGVFVVIKGIRLAFSLIK